MIDSKFLGHVNKLIQECDVLIEVLDARDPMGCRSAEVENRIKAYGGRKRLILVLNKIDLIPKQAMMDWMAYLRGEHPTIAFKASTQKKRITHNSSMNFGNTSAV